jgi:microcystin-dependent protein
MSDTPYLAEIRLAGFNYAPQGWALCNGQLLPINQNQALFSLLGTQYGGNGQTNFALPDLRGRAPLHQDGSFTVGTRGGEEAHTVTISELPTHTHFLQANSAQGDVIIPVGNLLAASPNQLYTDAANLVAMNPGTVTNTGGSQAHNNMQPYLVVSFMIALIGFFPTQD